MQAFCGQAGRAIDERDLFQHFHRLAAARRVRPSARGVLMPVARPRLHDAVRRAAWGLLVLALVAAQALGQWHRVVHAPGMPGHVAAHAAHPHGHEAHDVHAHAHLGETASSWAARLFDADGHAAACVLYDQLAHADGLPNLPVLWLPPVWVAALTPWEGRWQIAAQAVGFLARGPPRAA